MVCFRVINELGLTNYVIPTEQVNMSEVKRRIGLEQEFFIVDADGVIADRADELLHCCHQLAEAEGRNPDHFAPEFVKSMLEINTAPAFSVSKLADDYLRNLQLMLKAAKSLQLQLYPLSQYPLHLAPVIRDEANYHIQARTVGYERFLDAGRCIGTHLHLELPPGSLMMYHLPPELKR